MKKVLIIGSGISGLTAAIECAENGIKAVVVSPYPSERAQSVMAAGGINAAASDGAEPDSIECHVADTIKSGKNLSGTKSVTGLCSDAPDIINWLESLGVVFTRDKNGIITRRAFGGQTYKRTAFSGSSTGKQIMTALIQKTRQYECEGLVERKLGLTFHSALIKDNQCCGAMFFNEIKKDYEAIFADFVIAATGGQNSLFGKTTGSSLCDGYATGKLFLQGAALKNPEFVQYHPTSIETAQKRMLISEAARGEGGRLYYLDGDKRVYFMEDKFGEKGNLMPRDVVSKCEYDVGKQVYLDVAFLGEKVIKERLSEIYELCMTYLNLDITKESIPVAPSVHFFMGGLAVDVNHRTSVENLYAVGECASMYHGANRLGGNSLLAAVHSARVAAADISKRDVQNSSADFSEYIEEQCLALNTKLKGKSQFSSVYLMKNLAEVMNDDMGITRNEEKLQRGIESIDYYLSIIGKLKFDVSISAYQGSSLEAIFTLARAILTCAASRKETRGSHIREDYPNQDDRYSACTLVYYNDGKYDISYKEEDEICW